MALQAAASAKTQPEVSDAELISGFIQLNVYLKGKVNSEGAEENLEALRALIASEAENENKKKPLFGLFSKQEKTGLKVARRVAHLVEVADQADCNQQTVEYLSDLARAYSNQVLNHNDKQEYFASQGESATQEPRFHLRNFGRLDELLDSRLEIILAKCEHYYEQAYEQQLAGLDEQTNKRIHEVLDDATVEELDDIKHDHRVLLTRLAKRTDMDNYKAALEAQDKQVFAGYYRELYETNLGKPCKVFFGHFGSLMGAIDEVDAFCKRYEIPVRHSDQVRLARARRLECYMVNELAGDQVVARQAEQIRDDFRGDARFNNLKWQGEGRRLY